jgi:hypothetical protein
MMGTTDATVWDALGRGKLELSHLLEIESSSLGDSSRMVCSDSDPLWAMPPTIAPDSPMFGDGLKLSEQSAMNSRSLEWMAGVLCELDAEQKMSVTGGDSGYTKMREPSKHLEEKHAANPPS